MTAERIEETLEQTAPLFKVGQIVVMRSGKKQPVFRIMGKMWEDGWYYQFNRNNYANEHMLRALTPEEKGES